MTDLQLVTLNTGSTSRIAIDPAEIPAAAIDLGNALKWRGPPVDIEGRDGSRLMASAKGSSLVATILHQGEPLATIGVAERSLGSKPLWRMLHDTARQMPLATDPASPPAAPWCGVLVWPGLVTMPNAATWLADYEAQIALAWIAHCATRHP